MQQGSIPIIKLRGILIVSIQTTLSDRLVVRLKEDITKKISATKACGLVIDLTGIDIMDSFISRTIRDISMMAQLMGVKTVISGMDPMIAMTLVEMDMDMESVEAALNLDAAVDYLEPGANEENEMVEEQITSYFRGTSDESW